MFELLRKFSLLMLLFIVAMGAYLSAQNTTDWRRPLWVQVYPIRGDASDVTYEYVRNLADEDFDSIEEFMRAQSTRFGITLDQPVKMILGEEINELPPQLARGAGPFSIGLWSLKLRWWASSITSGHPGPEPDIRLFLIYFDPNESPVLSHSIGLQQGLVGIVNVFASESQAETNNFVIAHEMLHTLGATDKYDLRNNRPMFPEGYADPERQPLYPQPMAEIMGGRIPVNENAAVIPYSLAHVLVGPYTAEEIRWIR
jgi:hypothetical protein